MMALVLHKEIERKVNKLRHMRLDFMHTNQKKKKRIRKKPYARSVTVVINYYSLSFKNTEGGEGS